MSNAQDRYDDLFSEAYDRTLNAWIDADEPRRGIDFEQNGKSVNDALANVWTDDIETAVQWSDKALQHLNRG
jgi:hypothetical protein